jgi:hypothetical protein
MEEDWGRLGCFGGCVVILGLAILIMWQIMEAMGPG